MTTLTINLWLIEYIAVPSVAVILGVTIYFFIKSQRSLRRTLQANRPGLAPSSKKEKSASYKRSSIVDLEEQFARMRYEASIFSKEEAAVPARQKEHSDENMVHDLKNTIAEQQKMLTEYLARVEEMEKEGRDEMMEQNNQLQKEIHKLHVTIEKKDEEIEELFQQARTAQKMSDKIEEVYQEFEQLQAKMMSLEKQASRANNLAIELEDAKQSYEQAHRELTRKQEKLEEVLQENQRMRQEMNELEDKLSEANGQRQQLHKKVQFLQDLNNDMQSISDTNKKLQTELRRIGELESMLNMMAEERDFLLRKKPGK